MVLERLGRNVEDVVLQLLQRLDAENLFVGSGVAEYEVAKAHVFLNHLAQVNIELLRVLVEEVETLSPCFFAIGNLRALQNQWYILVVFSDGAQ